MDKQNANEYSTNNLETQPNLQDLDTLEAPADSESLVDKLEAKIFREGKVGNIRTQSLVESSRDDAQREYDRIVAQQQAYEHQQKVDAAVQTGSRAASYIAICILVVLIIGAGSWVAYNLFRLNSGGEIAEGTPDEPTVVEAGHIGTYTCKESDCKQILELSEDELLIRDDGYYVYNMHTGEVRLTTLWNEDFEDISLHHYGDKDYLVATTDKSALFNLTDNIDVTDFQYEEFIFDTTHEAYKGKTGIENSYIIAVDGDYRMISIKSGEELVRGTAAVYEYDPFYISYSSDGKRYVYNNEKRQVCTVLDEQDYIYIIKKEIVIVAKPDGQTTYYNLSGQRPSDNEIVKKYSRMNKSDILKTLRDDADAVLMPN